MKISIVTPSFNQAEFLEETLKSVLEQGYPDLEYVVIDGGSTDGSVDVIKRYSECLAYWVSEPDGGHYAAVNKGFAHTSGEVMAWINSDDKYMPWTFAIVADIFSSLPEVEWITTLYQICWNRDGHANQCHFVSDGFSKEGFFRAEHGGDLGPSLRSVVQQESTFWRRSLWERAGGRLDTSYPLAGDFELWARFYKLADLYGVTVPLSGFRVHGDQRSEKFLNDYISEANRALIAHGGLPYSRMERRIRAFAARHLPGRIRRAAGLVNQQKLIQFNPTSSQWLVVKAWQWW